MKIYRITNNIILIVTKYFSSNWEDLEQELTVDYRLEKQSNF